MPNGVLGGNSFLDIGTFLTVLTPGKKLIWTLLNARHMAWVCTVYKDWNSPDILEGKIGGSEKKCLVLKK